MSTLYRSTFYFKGKRYEKTSTKSQREADRKADNLKRDLENGVIGISSKMRVKDWAHEWLETYKRPKVADKGYGQYKRYIDNVIIPHIGGLKLTDVTDIHLQRIINERAGNSYSDLKQVKDILKAIFKRARMSRLITYDPAEGLEMPRYTKGKGRSITAHEREHFLKVAETHYAGLMFMTMLYCGLRSGEVIALQWKDLDFDKHKINVVSAMEAGKDVLKAPKTEAGIRKVDLANEIYSQLLKLRGEPFSPVFTQPTTGRRHTETSRAKAWNSIIKAMDDSMGAKWGKVETKDGKMRRTKIMSVVAPDLIPYCLRHTFCTDLRAKGIDVKAASYLMGHSSISLTLEIYTHITEEGVDKRVAKGNSQVQRAILWMNASSGTCILPRQIG